MTTTVQNHTRILPVFATLAIFGFVATDASGQVLVVDSDARGGSVSAYVDGIGSVDPVEQSYNTDPGESEYIAWDIDFLVEDGEPDFLIDAWATLQSQSAYDGWVEGDFEFDGLSMNSAGSATIDQVAAFSSNASSNELLEMGFRVESLPAGGASFHLQGSVDNGLVRLTGPGGLDMQFTSGPFDEIITIPSNGEYRLTGQGNASVSRSTPGFATESFAFDASLTIANCPADANGDGTVDVIDLLTVLNSWGSCSGCAADLNGDGQVDVVDMLMVFADWGLCP